MDKLFSLSRIVLGPQARFRTFSTTSALLHTKKRSVKKHKASVIKQANLIKQAKLANAIDRVDPVLGRPECEFYKRIEAQVREESFLAGGYETAEVEKLLYGAQKANSDGDIFTMDAKRENEEKKKTAILKILDMQNSSRAEERKLAIRLAEKEFARFEGDTGSAEVQAANMSMKIRYRMEHVKQHKKDLSSIRQLRQLVQQRQSILKYLKRSKPEVYYYTIEKLGLNDHAVTQEFNMDRQYLQDYKVWGDKILVKESKSQLEGKRKEARKMKKEKRNDDFETKKAEKAAAVLAKVDASKNSEANSHQL